MTITHKKFPSIHFCTVAVFFFFLVLTAITCGLDSLSASHRRNLPWHIPFRLWMENHIAKIFQSSGCPPQWLYWWGSPWNPKQPHALCTASCCWQASCLDSLWNWLFNKRWNRSKFIVGTLYNLVLCWIAGFSCCAWYP